MAYLKSYKELIVWQKSILLVKEIFILTGKFPKEELYGIVSQMRRSAISIPSNIAEGYGRRSTKSYTQFYAIAYGSALELETQSIIANELNMAPKENFRVPDNLIMEVSKMLNTMIAKMKQLNTDN
jgi:four helix bundle protein